jgi:hypothetical protein
MAHPATPERLLAGAALLLAAYAVLRGSPQAPVTSASDEVRAELGALRDEVAALRRERVQRQIAAAPAAPPTPADGGHTVEARPLQPTPPRYVRFEAPAGLHVEQVASGDLQVRSTDPSLTGQLLTITAVDQDGGRAALRILVPPPGA